MSSTISDIYTLVKKYSDKYDLSELLTISRVGFEFEFYSRHSYYKTLELLNNYLAPIKVWGFKQYHSKFKPDEKNFKIEPDYSGGSSMMELVTGPMSYTDCRLALLKILKFIQEECYTNDKSSLHINISFDPEKTPNTLQKLNILKVLLNMDEDKVYKFFPNRQNNIYAKSVKKIIPYKQFDYVNDAVNIAQNNVYIPSEKYYGINFKHIYDPNSSRLEYRYIGGEDYQFKVGEILDLLQYFVTFSWQNTIEPLDAADIKKLRKYFSENISIYKNFGNYDRFLTEYTFVEVHVNANKSYDVVNTYFSRFSDKLFDFLTSIEKPEKMLINFTTEFNRLEIVGAKVKTVLDLEGLDFIDCEIQNSMLNKCHVVNSTVNNTHLTDCKVYGSDLNTCKVTETEVDTNTILYDCYFYSGTMNGEMRGGIFRSGKIGEEAFVSPETKIVKPGETVYDGAPKGKKSLK